MERFLELILVRHGESTHQVNGLVGGWSESVLTARGTNQAELIGRRLEHIVDERYRFLSSDLMRAKQTSVIIGDHIGMPPCFSERLREMNFGAATGKSMKEAEQLRLPVTEPVLDWAPYPGAESWREMQKRIWGFLDAEIDPEFHYLIVSHGNAMVEIVNWYLRIDGAQMNLHYDFDNCSITILRENIWKNKTIHKLNDTSHLT
jgi:probable phosphoglycerate mutase